MMEDIAWSAVIQDGGSSGVQEDIPYLRCLLIHRSSSVENKIMYMSVGFREEIELEISVWEPSSYKECESRTDQLES